MSALRKRSKLLGTSGCSPTTRALPLATWKLALVTHGQPYWPERQGVRLPCAGACVFIDKHPHDAYTLLDRRQQEAGPGRQAVCTSAIPVRTDVNVVLTSSSCPLRARAENHWSKRAERWTKKLPPLKRRRREINDPRWPRHHRACVAEALTDPLLRHTPNGSLLAAELAPGGEHS